MEFEDMELVIIRLCLLVFIVIFGITGNAIAVFLNARSFRQNKLNGIAYLHLGCLDLLLCMFHAPIGIGLESCGYFSLHNDVADRNAIWLVTIKQISLRVFFFSCFQSYVTLGSIAYLRCWAVFNPFGRPGRKTLISVLLISDVVASIIVVLSPTPEMSMVTSNFTSANTENATHNKTSGIPVVNDSYFDVSLGNISVGETYGLFDGKTVIGDHGVTVDLLIYTTGATMLVVIICYILISYKLQRSFGQLSADLKKTGLENIAKRSFLQRQVSHVKTHVILIVTLMITVMPTVVIALGGFQITYAMTRLRSTIVAFSSAVNPYVYCLLKASNRREIYNILTCNRTNKLNRPGARICNKASTIELPRISPNTGKLSADREMEDVTGSV